MSKKKPGRLRLEIQPPDGFEHAETEPGDPLTFLCEEIEAAFQVSVQPGVAEGEDWGDEDLIRMASDIGREGGSAEPAQTMAEDCDMGRYGMAAFSSAEFPLSQNWVITDGTHVIIATLTCGKAPNEDHLREVWETVHALNLVPA